MSTDLRIVTCTTFHTVSVRQIEPGALDLGFVHWGGPADLFNETILVDVNLAEGSGHRVSQPCYLHDSLPCQEEVLL